MAEPVKLNSKFSSTSQKQKGFYGKYSAICKAKNIPVELKPKRANEIHTLDFFADRLRPHDWVAICSALTTDFTLKSLAIRTRRPNPMILNEIDTLKKAKSLTNHPVVLSKFIFAEIIDALREFLSHNEVIEELALEGLPLTAPYLTILINALRSTSSLKSLSFSRCHIGDDACEMLCMNIKHLANIQTLNLSTCDLTPAGAESVMKYIKQQRIVRFSHAWISSLRYQQSDCATGGIRKILLNNNVMIGDNGLKIITDELREDTWIKEVHVQNCGLSQAGAEQIINCLTTNNAIKVFDVSHNAHIPLHFVRSIHQHLNHTESSSSSDGSLSSSDSGLPDQLRSRAQLLEKVKALEATIEMEVNRRQDFEKCHGDLDRMTMRAMEMMQYLEQEKNNLRVPAGYTLVKSDVFEEIINDEIEEIKPRVEIELRRHKRSILRKIGGWKGLERNRKVAGLISAIENLKTSPTSIASPMLPLSPPPPHSPSSFASVPAKISLKTSTTQTPLRAQSYVDAPKRDTSKSTIKERAPYYETNIGDYFHNDEKVMEQIYANVGGDGDKMTLKKTKSIRSELHSKASKCSVRSEQWRGAM